MYKKFKILCVNKNFGSLTILFLGLVIAAILELIGIGSIPIFVMLITDVDLLKSKLPEIISNEFLFGLSNMLEPSLDIINS